MKSKVLCVLAALAIVSCASAKPVLRTIDSAAQTLCALSFAEKRGLSVSDAIDIYCSTQEQLRPWIDDALSAQRRTALKLEHPIVTEASTIYIERSSDAGAE